MDLRTLDRRSFLRTLAASLAALITLQIGRKIRASESEEAGSHKWVMVIDTDKCTGCNYCVYACQAHNDTAPEIEWNRVIKSGKAGDREVFLPRPCMHCAHAPCVTVCPVKASYQRDDGIVMMDYDRCIGCRYCQIACPYGARAFNWDAFVDDNPVVPEWGKPEIQRRPRGVVEKCSFCFHRIDRGMAQGWKPGVAPEATPACVNVCPVGARIFGDINEPGSNVSRALATHPHFRLREDMGTDPSVYYLPARWQPE